jgi:hypothetical protein
MKIALADRNFADDAVRRGIAAAHRELAGQLLDDIDIDQHPVRGRAGLVGDAHALEIAEIVQPPLRPVDQDAVIGIAFEQIELAPDHMVARARIADDIDALDIDPRAFFDDEQRLMSWPCTSRSPRGRTCAKA